MSPSNGPSGEMDENLWSPRLRDPLHIDDGTVDRLLDGLPVDDAPPSYRGVAELLHTIKAAPMAPRDEFWAKRFGAAPRVSITATSTLHPEATLRPAASDAPAPRSWAAPLCSSGSERPVRCPVPPRSSRPMCSERSA